MNFQSQFTITKYNFVPNKQVNSTSPSAVCSNRYRKDAWESNLIHFPRQARLLRKILSGKITFNLGSQRPSPTQT